MHAKPPPTHTPTDICTTHTCIRTYMHTTHIYTINKNCNIAKFSDYACPPTHPHHWNTAFGATVPKYRGDFAYVSPWGQEDQEVKPKVI